MTATVRHGSCEELLYLGGDPVGIGEPGRVVHAVDLKQPRTRDMVGEVPAALHRNGVLAGMDNEGWHGDRRQNRPHVIRIADSSVARAIPGLAHMRSNMASWRIDRTDGSRHLSAAPLPHAELAARPSSSQRASCSVEGV